MRLLALIPVILLTGCTCFVAGAGGVQTASPGEEPGQGYRDSQVAAMLACSYKEDNREPQQGDGYRDSQNAAEDADCHEDH